MRANRAGPLAAGGRIGITELARRLGLSVSTVSRALNGYDDVNAETRQRVVDGAQLHNYVPSAGAQRLRHGRTNAVGFVFSPLRSEFIEPFYLPLLAGIDERLREEGYDLFVTAARPGDEEAQIFPRLVEGHRVDALLFARTRPEDWRVGYLQQRGFPFAALGRSRGTAPYACTDLDYDAVAYQACGRLIALGHERIGLVLPPFDLMVAQFMREGCRRALEEAGRRDLDVWEYEGDQTAEGGMRAAEAFAAAGGPSTGLICGSDLAAIGLMGGLRQKGIIPGVDVAVIGCGDNPLAPSADPPLTTFSFPLSQVGRDLVDVLLPQLRPDAAVSAPHPASPELILRKSDCAAPTRDGEPRQPWRDRRARHPRPA